jgi:hypothetical protein
LRSSIQIAKARIARNAIGKKVIQQAMSVTGLAAGDLAYDQSDRVAWQA